MKGKERQATGAGEIEGNNGVRDRERQTERQELSTA